MAGAADLRSYVAANTRRQREKLGLTQQELAERMRVTPRYIRALESGETNLTLNSLSLLAHVLGVQAGVLIRRMTLQKRGRGRPAARTIRKRRSVGSSNER